MRQSSLLLRGARRWGTRASLRLNLLGFDGDDTLAAFETQEELRITATGVVEAGRLWFDFVDGTKIHCIVFRADDFDGEPTETDEACLLMIDQLDDIRNARRKR